jgi:hypothetical protein
VLTGEDLVAAVPAIQKVAHVRADQISNISSSDMNPEIWMLFARRVDDLLTIFLIEFALCLLPFDEIRSWNVWTEFRWQPSRSPQSSDKR